MSHLKFLPVFFLSLVACDKPAARVDPKAVRAVAAALNPSDNLPLDTPAQGRAGAKITVVEYSDFQCGFCARVLPTLKELQGTYGDELRIVFRNNPLPFHSDAPLAAEAALAAHDQGKFWQFHDALFAHQRALDRASLEKYAETLSLNLPQFKAALDSGKFKARVQQDLQAASAAGVRGTPTFVINGRKLVGAQPMDAFKTLITEELARADKLLAEGVSRESLYGKLVDTAPSEKAPAVVAAPPEKVEDLQLAGAPAKGPANAPITLAVFSDFQCPFCSRAVPTLKELESLYPGKIKVVFKQQPLPFHENARLAAEASFAAAEQGKFWELHDELFAHQSALDRASLENHARKVGLNVSKFKAALDSHRFEAAVSADMQEASRVGVNGTPTFFINGRRLVGAQPTSAFKTLIDQELVKAGK
ncbi:MAG: DsbA family protein [Myxococcaceae bacterium]